MQHLLTLHCYALLFVLFASVSNKHSTVWVFSHLQFICSGPNHFMSWQTQHVSPWLHLVSGRKKMSSKLKNKLKKDGLFFLGCLNIAILCNFSSHLDCIRAIYQGKTSDNSSQDCLHSRLCCLCCLCCSWMGLRLNHIYTTNKLHWNLSATRLTPCFGSVILIYSCTFIAVFTPAQTNCTRVHFKQTEHKVSLIHL